MGVGVGVGVGEDTGCDPVDLEEGVEFTTLNPGLVNDGTDPSLVRVVEVVGSGEFNVTVVTGKTMGQLTIQF